MIRSDSFGEAAEQLSFLLGGWFAAPDGVERNCDIDWAKVLELARATKTTALLSVGCERRKLVLPPEVSADIDRARQENLQKNARNVAFTKRVASTFESAGITVIVLKGPLRTQQLYGSIDLRPSGDIDLLVSPNDYEQAGYLLQTIDYVPLVSAQDKWWHTYLGESPYVHKGMAQPIIDLHSEVQQPGGPYPKNLDDFLATAENVKLGNQTVRVFSSVHAAMLTAIGFGKAIRSQEAWLLHAHEMQTALAQMDENTRTEFERQCRSDGIERLAQSAIMNSARIFGLRSPDGSDVRHLKAGLESPLGEEQKQRVIMRRSRLLWNWTDGSGLARLMAFLRGAAHMFRSDIARQWSRS